MKLNEFLEPYRLPNGVKSDGLGSNFKFWNNKKIPPNSVLLCGLSDLSGRTKHLNDLRNIFYQLAGFKSNRSLVDLGNIVSLSQDDRSDAFKILLGEVKRSKSILIVLSAEKESIQILLDSQRKNEKSIAFITPCFNDSYQELVQERLVNNVNLLAVQSHFSNTEKALNNSQIELVTLGQVRDDIMDAEPYFRMVDALSVNMSAIRKSDFSFSHRNSPNGLYAEEVCQMAWFAGNSDSINAYHIAEIPLNTAQDSPDLMMSAQVLWYILTGIVQRHSENPSKNTRNFKEYYIENNKTPDEVVFYKSINSNKFWVKYGKGNVFIPCSKKDMNVVLEGNFPSRLLKRIAVHQKKH